MQEESMTTSKAHMGLVAVIVAQATGSDNDEIKRIKEEVREIMDHTEEYTSAEECEKFVRSVRYEYIFIITTVDLINDIFTQNIHQIRHVQSIFLLDPHEIFDSPHINDLRKSSYKMQEVCISSIDLIQCIWKCVHECANGSDVLLSTLAGCSSNAMTTNVVNNIADFAELWFPLYIDFLFELPMVDPDEEQRRFVEQCRRHFAQNPGALKLIDEFGEDYMPHGALYYYSCDGFFYRLVNRALRRQTIEGIRDFRFLLFDIRDQLQLAHGKFLDKDTTVGMSKIFFRGQRMYDGELKELQKKHHDGTLITTNSYFSTSESVEVARVFAGKPEKGIVSILFKITAEIKDPQIKQRKPFAKIGSYSNFGEAEREVLFSIGSFFKIDNIEEESPSFWIVKMTLIDEEDKNQTVTDDFRTLRNCSLETKIIKIGDLLGNHPRQGISQAKAFYDFIKISKFSEALQAASIAGLGWLAFKETNATLAIEQQQIALSLYERLKLEGESESLTHLYITSYNCIGTSFRLIKRYRRALEYYSKAEKLLLKVPIDKYAMYEGYRNITSINISLTHKLLGQVDEAWDHYKKILAYEMNTSTRFHGHTYLTIAQAGLHEAKTTHDADEYDRYCQTWKAFLDLSLTNMSSSYRRSIISGVLLIGFQYANNEQTRTMAIDYFQKVIRISRRYVNVNRDDYHIVLECLNQLARLHTKRHQYAYSMNHSLEALNMCHEDDLADIAECYESMAINYEQQLLDHTNELTPDDIRRMIIDNPFANTTEPTIPRIVLAFQRNEFAFGQSVIKTMNPKFSEETDLQRCLAYCHLKLATLAQAQGYKDNDDRLENKAHQWLDKVAELVKEDPQVRWICMNNMNYLNKDFDSIINNYREDLRRNQQENKICIGEDAFSYIAHLYARKKDVDEEQRWHNLAVQYFESHGYVCEHTVMCFRKLAHFYEKHENVLAAINAYERLSSYLLEHLPCSFLRTSIKPIGMKIVEHFNEQGDSKRALTVLQDLVDLMLIESANGERQINEQFRKLIAKCMDTGATVNLAYEQYFEVFLRHKPQPFDSFMHAIEPAFRLAISVYQIDGNYPKCIETYQQYIELLVSGTTNHQSTEAAFKRLALDFESLRLFDVALDMYSYLGKFIVKYQKKDDILITGFVIVRCKFVKISSGVFHENAQQMFIQIMKFYQSSFEPHDVYSEYFKSRNANVDRRSVSGIYLSLLEYCFQYRSEFYENHMTKNIIALSNRPLELIAFITSHRVNYKMLILDIFQRFGNRSVVHCSSKQFSSNSEAAIMNWLSTTETNRAVYWSQLLRCLLEWQSIDDEHLAQCYTTMGDTHTAALLFDIKVYGDPALQFNSNACRRYLRYVYSQASDKERMNLEHQYQKHFLVECDSFSDRMFFDILPME